MEALSVDGFVSILCSFTFVGRVGFRRSTAGTNALANGCGSTGVLVYSRGVDGESVARASVV